MPNTVLIGAQWGDEGKGKIVDVLTEEADVVVRYQGGSNAGHTIEIGAERYVLHLIPSGILHSGKVCVIGNGLVVDPLALVAEIKDLAARGIDAAGRLWISERAHLVLECHKALDAARESAAEGAAKIGTTRRGIGPAYSDKATRVGLRMIDLLAADLPGVFREIVREKNRQLVASGAAPVDEAGMIAQLRDAADFLRPFIADAAAILNKAYRDGQAILFEGAQGTMLDIDFGSYPYVTSSNATVGGALTGTGLPPRAIDSVVGVIKAYSTRVGEGPFPTELKDATGDMIRQQGREFGATTGRPRRCGWFDAVVARYAAMINGFDYWAVTKLDVLDRVPTIKVCTAYEYGGRRFDTMPADAHVLAACTPVYEEIPGWNCPTNTITRFAALPAPARAYVDRLCALTGVPLGILSVGPRRDSTFRIAI